MTNLSKTLKKIFFYLFKVHVEVEKRKLYDAVGVSCLSTVCICELSFSIIRTHFKLTANNDNVRKQILNGINSMMELQYSNSITQNKNKKLKKCNMP